MIVSRYGLHTSGGIPFLLQRNGAQNLISPQLHAPFEPQIRPRNANCPHSIVLRDHHDIDLPPLARAFLPTPRAPGEKAVWVYDPDQKLDVLTLCRLASPTEQIPRPIWWRHAEKLAPTYGITNLGPLVWTAAGIHNTDRANRHIELAKAAGRRIIIVAVDRLPLFDDVEQLEPCSLDASLPLELIGTGHLYRHMMDIQNGRS